MPSGNTDIGLDRRKMLKALGVGGIAGLAGCTGGDDQSTPEGTEGEDGGDGTATETPAQDLGETLVGPDGEQVSLKMVYSTGSETTRTTAQFFQQEYGKMGIDVSLQGVPFNTMLSKYAQNTYAGDGEERSSFNAGPRDESTSEEQWDLMAGIGFNSYPRTPTSIRPFWTDERKREQSTVNFYGYRPSEDIAAMLDEASSETDETARQELLSEVFGILSRDQPVNFYQFSVDLNGFQQNVRGISAGPSIGYDSQQRYLAPDESGSPSVQGSYVVGSGTDAKTLNPIRINDTSSDARLGLALDGAYSLGNDDEFVPRWVTEVNTDDKQTYEVVLRDGLRWGAGYGQMTAEDWVYYIEEVHQAEDNWAGDVNQSDWFRDDAPIPVEQTGELTFEIRLPSVDPAFVKKPVMWGAYCLPKALVEKYRGDGDGEGLNQDPDVQEIAYSGNLGPYTYERWDRESVFVATRNDDYYLADDDQFVGDDAPYFEDARYQVFGEESTRLSAFETGEITATGIPPGKASRFEDLDSTKVIQTPNAFCSIMAYNQRANGWGELRKTEVRRALSMGVNKQVIVDNINRGYANAAHTHQPEYSAWFDDSKVQRTGVGDSYSTAMAKQLLDENLSSDYSFE
jgi:peptide/nickel transport system substrate-binding protein